MGNLRTAVTASREAWDAVLEQVREGVRSGDYSDGYPDLACVVAALVEHDLGVSTDDPLTVELPSDYALVFQVMAHVEREAVKNGSTEDDVLSSLAFDHELTEDDLDKVYMDLVFQAAAKSGERA